MEPTDQASKLACCCHSTGQVGFSITHEAEWRAHMYSRCSCILAVPAIIPSAS